MSEGSSPAPLSQRRTDGSLSHSGHEASPRERALGRGGRGPGRCARGGAARRCPAAGGSGAAGREAAPPTEAAAEEEKRRTAPLPPPARAPDPRSERVRPGGSALSAKSVASATYSVQSQAPHTHGRYSRNEHGGRAGRVVSGRMLRFRVHQVMRLKPLLTRGSGGAAPRRASRRARSPPRGRTRAAAPLCPSGPRGASMASSTPARLRELVWVCVGCDRTVARPALSEEPGARPRLKACTERKVPPSRGGQRSEPLGLGARQSSSRSSVHGPLLGAVGGLRTRGARGREAVAHTGPRRGGARASSRGGGCVWPVQKGTEIFTR